MAEPVVLDVRDMRPAVRHPRIFQTFDALGPGDGMELVNDHNPKPLLYQFQFERAAAFEWWPLEQGPDAWRVLIVKRDSAPGEGRSAADLLGQDHKRLDALFREHDEALAAGDLDRARARFWEFQTGLARHITQEEHFLFPEFERRSGLTDGPTAVMRAEHCEILRYLNAIEATLGANADPDDGLSPRERASRLGRELIQLLYRHNQKEEMILYPESDRLLGDRDADDLVRRMQAL